MNFWKSWNKAKEMGAFGRSWMLGTIIGIVLLVLGVYHGQFTDIYRKAVMICLECIGIG